MIAAGVSCEINQGAELNPFGGSIRLANRVWIGPYVVIYGHGGVEIGEWSMVAMHATILSSNHSVPGLDRCMRWEKDVLLPTKIGRDVWIGANAVILGGVSIGDGAVIAAGSIVARDVAAGFIVAGNPAVVVKKRK
jgi:acetyltransferase-like isoleucine patch superfamily enzyme